MWALPRPERRLQRDVSHVQMDNLLPKNGDGTAFASKEGSTLARKMSRKIGSGLSRMFSRRGRRVEESTASVF